MENRLAIVSPLKYCVALCQFLWYGRFKTQSLSHEIKAQKEVELSDFGTLRQSCFYNYSSSFLSFFLKV
jgi:hypothetical protein